MSNPNMSNLKRALISVSDKTGLAEFAKTLTKTYHFQILSTGGTAKLLREHHIPVTDVSEVTGFPEIMDGRVKTLHPKIHGGLLGRRGKDDAVMKTHDIHPIDLVVVNLYPFTQTIQKPDCDLATAIENIDIGGPAMLRAAAKNHQDVTVVVDPQDYATVLDAMSENRGVTTLELRQKLAQKVFAHTGTYDQAIAHYLKKQTEEATTTAEFPETYNISFKHKESLRYGENPHQQAAFYVETNPPENGVGTAKQLQGKALSYNNIADTDAAVECVKGLLKPACVIVKHANPCGVATGHSVLEAYERAYACDPVSAFGGIIAFNHECDAETANQILNKQFVEVVIAPSVSDEALEVFAKKPNVRVLACGKLPERPITPWHEFKRVCGGLLVQDRDIGLITATDCKLVTEKKPTDQQFYDLLFAWHVVKFVKSNAIIYVHNEQTVGIGAGQMSRIVSAKIAAMKAEEAKLQVRGCVMASDAFFPFRDSIDAAASVGISAIIQPGGSMRDEEVISAANEKGIAMVFTGMRHFRH